MASDDVTKLATDDLRTISQHLAKIDGAAKKILEHADDNDPHRKLATAILNGVRGIYQLLQDRQNS